MRTGAQNFVIPHTLLGRTPVGVCDEGPRAARWPGQAHTGGQATLALVTNHPAARKERPGCVDWALSLFLYGAQCGVNSASAHAESLRAARTPTASGLAGAAFAALVTQRNRGLCEGAQSPARAAGRGPFAGINASGAVCVGLHWRGHRERRDALDGSEPKPDAPRVRRRLLEM